MPQTNGTKQPHHRNADGQRKPQGNRPSGWRWFSRFSFGIIKWMVLLGIVGAASAAAAVTGYVSALVQDDVVRSRDTIVKEMQINSETGFVYFNDGTVIGQLRTDEDRRLIRYSDIPKHVEDAVLSIEDAEFYDHIGVDLSGLLRAVKQKLLNEDTQTGGSTITQQVARRVFLSLDRTDSRKFKEILLSLRLERYLTKQEILAAYLNKIPFGNGSTGYNAYGIKAAAKGIFDLELDELNIAQAAYLAGLPQQPSVFSAFKSSGAFDPEGFRLAKERQELVLSRMLATGKITQREYNQAMAFDLRGSLAEPKAKAYSTYPYLMLEAERKAAEILLRLSNPELTDDQMKGPAYLEALEDAKEKLLQGGYKIYTTIDQTVYDAMHRISDNPELYTADDETKGVEQVGSILLDNRTGAILGMIEGRDFYLEQLNHATQMQRQPGSAMKTVAAYLPALDSGAIQPGSAIDDIPVILPDGSKGVHIPQNWDGRYHGVMTIREALNQSWNIPAIKLFTDVVTIPKAWEFVEQLGIRSITESDHYARTGVIGGLEYGVSVEELTNAYSSIANQGRFNDAYFIQKITDSNDVVVYEHKVEPTQVFSEQTAYLMTDLLRTVVSSGTGTRVLSRFEHEDTVPIVGKTGTTSENYDLWFVGYSPDVTLGVWIGYDQPSTLREANRAKWVWADIMNELVVSKEELFVTGEFPKPDDIVSKTVSKVSGLLPSEIVLQEKLTVTDLFNRKYIPTRMDDVLGVTNVVMTPDGTSYLPQPGTPEDMMRKMRVLRREPPISELMKQIEEALERLPEKSRKPLAQYRPTDGFGDDPAEIDPRMDDGADPSAPVKTTLLKTETGVKVMFAPSYSKDVAGYRVFRSTDGGPFGQMIGRSVLTGDDPSFTDQVGNDHVYGYYVVAVDIAGRVSAPSPAVYTADTLPFPDPAVEEDSSPELFEHEEDGETTEQPIGLVLTPPEQPTATKVDLGVRLTWTANPEDQLVEEYHVFYAPEEDGPYRRIGSAKGGTRFDYLTISPGGWYRLTAGRDAQQSDPSAPVHFEP